MFSISCKSLDVLPADTRIKCAAIIRSGRDKQHHFSLDFSEAGLNTGHINGTRLYRNVQLRIIRIAMKIDIMSMHNLPQGLHLYSK